MILFKIAETGVRQDPILRSVVSYNATNSLLCVLKTKYFLQCTYKNAPVYYNSGILVVNLKGV
jgi:hypothetical protein